METTQTAGSPLGRLVLFMLCLAVIGTITAGGYYLAVELPSRPEADSRPPDNSANIMCANCLFKCNYDPKPFECRSHCDLVC